MANAGINSLEITTS